MNDEYSAHYGVKGMHWGVRKVQPGEMQTTLNNLKKKNRSIFKSIRGS